jgi:hypothetical protein
VDPAGLPALADELGGEARIPLETPRREAVADAALRRPELAATPGPAVTRPELLAMLEAAGRR